MLLKANYHTHTYLCGHAKGTINEYVESAIKEGYQILGMSDHGPHVPKNLPRLFYWWYGLFLQMSLNDFYSHYLPDFYQARAHYKDKIQLYLGIETEYTSRIDSYIRKLRDQLDYMILGVHFFETKKSLHNVYLTMNKHHVIDYAKAVEKALDTGMYHILAHPDIYAMRYLGKGKNIFDETCEKAAEIIIEAAIRNNVYLEINVGGMRKKPINKKQIQAYKYPKHEFWEIVSNYQDAKTIIGVDAHHPDHLKDDSIKEAMEFAQKYNLNVVSEIDFSVSK